MGNYIGSTSRRADVRKIMSIPDEMIFTYYELVAAAPRRTLRRIKASLESGASPRT